MSEMIVVLQIVVLCRFTIRSYAANVMPVSYSWSTFTGPVSGEVEEVKPWKSSPSSSLTGFESPNDESNGPDYVAKPDYSFAYGVDDPNTGSSHGHSEKREGSLVTGEYTVTEPDGTLRRVLYTADPENGFRASVRYMRPDGETAQDHGYRDHHEDRDRDRPPGPQPPPPPPPPPQSSEYAETADDEPVDDDDPYAPPPPSLPTPSSLHFGGFDGPQHYGNDVNSDDAADYEDDRASGIAFKFPSPRPYFKTNDADTDSDDYGGGTDSKYRYSGAFGPASSPSPFDSPVSSPSPFGLPPSSPSPFGLPPSPPFGLSSFSRPVIRPPSTPEPCAPLSRSPFKSSLTAETLSYQTGHSNGFDRPSIDLDHNHDDDDDDGAEPFRSLAGDFEVDHDDVEIDPDDTADVVDVTEPLPSGSVRPRQPRPSDSVQRTLPSDSAQRLLPSGPSQSSPSSSSPTPHPAVVSRGSPTAVPSSSQPQPTPQFNRLSVDLSPTPTMTPIEPTIIDID